MSTMTTPAAAEESKAGEAANVGPEPKPLDALHTAVKAVRRGGTVSVVGVYAGQLDPLPMMEMFDRGITIRMGQCHVKRWIDEILPVVEDDKDPLGTLDMTTHHLPLEQAPHGYDIFQKKADGCIKVVLNP